MAEKPYSLAERNLFRENSLEYFAKIGRPNLSDRFISAVRTLVAAPVFTPVLDISHWNNDSQPGGVIDFKALYAAGYRGLYIKATERLNYVDPYVGQNFYGALEGGFRAIGFYHFFRGNADGGAQAQFHLNNIEPFKQHVGGKLLPSMFDFETTDGVTKAVRVSRARTMLLTTTTLWPGKVPVLYSSAWFWNTYMAPTGWAGEYRFFPAHWTPASEPIIANEWPRANVDYWQWCVCPLYYWCNPCPLPLPGSWDLGRFYGTEEELLALAGHVPQTWEQAITDWARTVDPPYTGPDPE